MHVDEVINALTFAKTNLEGSKIVKLAQELIGILNRHVQANQPKDSFEEQRKALVEALRAITINKLTNNEKSVLKTYEALSLIGNPAAERIESIFLEHGIDPALALKKMQGFQAQVNTFLKITTQALAGLLPLTSEKEWDVEKNEEVLRITFQNDACISNVVNLKEHASAWHEIMRGFSMAAESSPDAVRIISIREGSFILEIAAISGLVLAIGKSAKVILEGIEKYYSILQKAEDIKKLKLQNAQIAIDLVKEAESYVDIQAEQIAKDVIEECFPQKHDGEVKEAVKRGVKKLFTFLKNGGGLDYQPFEGKDKEPIALQLQDVFTNIRTIDNQIKELKYLVAPDTNDDKD